MGSNAEEKDNNTSNAVLNDIAKKAVENHINPTQKAVKVSIFKKILPFVAPLLGVLLAVQIAVTLPFLAINMIGANVEATVENVTISNIEAEQAAIDYIGKSVKGKWTKAKNEAKKALNFLFGTNLSVGIEDENFTSKVSEDEVYSIMEGTKDYESSMNAIARVMDLYLQDALDHRRQEVSSHTGNGQIATYNGDTKHLKKIDYDLTLANFDAQGNPFTNVNYAALIAAYAASDYQIDENNKQPASNVNALIQALKNGEPDMLGVKYIYLDENGEQFLDEEVTPVPVYNYVNQKTTVNQDQYIQYLQMQEEQDPRAEVKKAVLKVLKNKYDINTQNSRDTEEQISNYTNEISRKQNQITENNRAIESNKSLLNDAQDKVDEYKKKKNEAVTANMKEVYQKKENEWQQKVDEYKHTISSYEESNSTLQREIDALNNQIASLKKMKEQYDSAAQDASALRTKVKNGTKKALAEMIEKEYMTSETYEITVLAMKRTKGGKPDTENIRYIKNKNGEQADDYQELPGGFGKDKYGKNLYMITGSSIHYPEIDTKYYAKVVLVPYKSTDVFKIFGIDSNAIYEPSAKFSEGSQITYEQRYNQYYDTIYEKCENLRGATFMSSSLAHASSLSTEDIKALLDSMPADTSGNRKEFIKNLLYLVGAVPYDFGGDPSGPGWNSEWWTPKANGAYRGLDCSSYVQWGVWTTFGSRLDAFNSTAYIFDNCQIIDKEQLKPGDLVLQQGVHVAVFLGYQDGKMLYVHLGGGASGTEPPEVTTNAFSKGANLIYCRMSMIANLEGNELYKEEITPFGIAAGNDLYIITKTLNGECGDGGDGFLAVCEACNNHANASGLSMLEQVSYGNGSYLEAYKRIFVNGESYAKEPTAADYAMVQQVMSGQRVIFPGQNNVMYWRAHGHNPGSKYQFVKTVGGNDFYYAK